MKKEKWKVNNIMRRGSKVNKNRKLVTLPGEAVNEERRIESNILRKQ